MSNKDNRQNKDYTDMKSHPETIDVQSGRMEAPASTLQKSCAALQKLSVFSATIKVRQICLRQKS